MNRGERHGLFLIAIFVVMFSGVLLLKWTTFQSIMLLAFMMLIIKLTDIEEAIEKTH